MHAPTDNIDALLDALNEVDRVERDAHEALSAELARAMSLLNATLATLRAA